MKKIITGWMAAILCAVFPCLQIYFTNAGEAEFTDVLPIVLFYLIIVVVLCFLFSFIFKNFTKSIAMANATATILFNFELFVYVVTMVPHKYIIVSAVCIVVLIAVCILLRRLDEEFVLELNTVFCALMAILLVINIVQTIPTIVQKRNAVASNPILKDLMIEEVNPETAPNVYYLLFDEYGGPQNLEQFFDYDNAEFLDFLEDKKFNLSRTSFNMEGVSTFTIIPDLLNLDYLLNDEMLIAERRKYMINPPLYTIMDDLGYEINTCSHITFLDNKMSTRAYSSGEYHEGKAWYFVLKRGIFIHPYNALIAREEAGPSYSEILANSIAYFMELTDEVAQEETPQFCMGYFKAPHYPYVFRADGQPGDSPDKIEWNDEKYLSYLQWTNARAEEMIENIIEEDPGAIIIVQSDHGARLIYHAEKSGPVEDQSKEIYQHNILNCVYYKGEVFDIEGLNGINTLRKILNDEFELALEEIPYEG